MGAGQLIKGFESALMDMGLNEKKTFTLTPDEAYGAVDEDRKHTFPRADIPAEMDPQVGQTVGLTTQDGQQVPVGVLALAVAAHHALQLGCRAHVPVRQDLTHGGEVAGPRHVG